MVIADDPTSPETQPAAPAPGPPAPPPSTSADPAAARRTELILRRIDTLPTLPPVALRLLALTSDDDASAADVVRLVESDPALTATVLRLCRVADRAGSRRDPMPTLARAIALLGFNTLRSAVLTVGVLQSVPPPHPVSPAASGDPVGLDRPGFWRHSLAVAVAAERLARNAPRLGIDPGLAFVAGLLHDLGKLALDHVLPQAYAQVVELARTHRGDLAAWETRVLGVDHHRAGRRLAEHWGLPVALAQAMALHRAPASGEPGAEGPSVGDLPRLIGVADALVRERHVGYSGNHTTPHAAARGAAMGFERSVLDTTASALFPALADRAAALGLDDTPSDALVQQSLDRARDALGHAHAALDDRSRRVAVQHRVLQALTAFTRDARPAGGVDDALDAIATSAGGFLRPGVRALLHAPADPVGPAGTHPWTIQRFDSDGPREVKSQPRALLPPTGALETLLTVTDDADAELRGVPWLAQQFERPDGLRVLPLGRSTQAWLIHPGNAPAAGAGPDALAVLAGVWGHALAAAEAHDLARRVSEDLARTGDALARARSGAAEREGLARLGEMAAGAAHEMNNPLAVIRGRSQLLRSQLPPDAEPGLAAAHIERAALQLTDLITGLRTFADPPVAARTAVDIVALVGAAIAAARDTAPRRSGRPPTPIDLRVGPGVGRVVLDRELVREALGELLTNAMQSGPRTEIVVQLQIQPPASGTENTAGGPRLLIEVRDDGAGMDAHTLAHAADPFFSARPAGRGVGMGLPRARRWAEAHGGTLRIESDPQRGTAATLNLPVDSPAV